MAYLRICRRNPILLPAQALKEGRKEWGGEAVSRAEMNMTMPKLISCPHKSWLSWLVQDGTQPCISSGNNQIQVSPTPFTRYYVVAPTVLAKKRAS